MVRRARNRIHRLQRWHPQLHRAALRHDRPLIRGGHVRRELGRQTPGGAVTFATDQISTGAISYNVDGVSVTKSIERQTWRNENINGVYTGAIAGNYTGCGGAVNGYYEAPITLNVGHDGASTVTMREEGADYFCNYNGAYTQAGRMGHVQGNGTCSDGTNQSFIATEVQGSIQALTMRLFSQFAGSCVFNGRLSGVRRGG